MNDRVVRSPLLPGGDLIAAVLDRQVMSLADRGGASNLVGDRWADVSADHAARWMGSPRPVPGDATTSLHVERLIRLDDTPAIAAAASKRGLQNPDLLILGSLGNGPVIQAADAKFSIETARSKQVSPSVVEALLDLLPRFIQLIDSTTGTRPLIVPGVFLSPDYPLTHLMLQRRRGILRSTVHPDEVVLVPVDPATFFRPLEGSGLIPILASVDALPVRFDESLLVGLYYFRLARAAVGCWFDSTKPLLLLNDRVEVDEAAIQNQAQVRTTDATTALELVLQWHADVQTVRAERAAVEQVAALPLINRELRELALRMASQAGVDPPSVNQIRRRVGRWYRERLREQVGPLRPPVADLPRTLQHLGWLGKNLGPEIEVETVRVIDELLAERVADTLDPLTAKLNDGI